MGELIYYPEYMDLIEDDKSIVQSLHQDMVFQTVGHPVGYFKIDTKENGAIILQPSILQALEYNARVLCSVYNDITEHLYYLEEHNKLPKDGTSLFYFTVKIGKRIDFVLEFAYRSKEFPPTFFSQQPKCVIIKMYFKVLTVNVHTIHNRCIVDAGPFLEFLQAEVPFVGVLTSGLINLKACQEEENDEENFVDVNLFNFSLSLMDNFPGYVWHSDKYKLAT